jgi:peroxiredoxin
MQRATEDLKNSRILDKVIKVGESAPEFSLPDVNGKLVELKGLLDHGPVVISFYRGQW